MDIVKKTIIKEWLIRKVDVKLFMMSRIFSSFISILMMFLLSKASEHFLDKRNADNFLQYSVYGLIIYNFSLSIIMGVGRAIINERRTDTLKAIVISGERLYKILIGVFLANIPIAFVETFLLFFSSVGLNFIKISVVNWIDFLVAMLVFLLTILSMGFVLSLSLGCFSETYIIQNTAIHLLLVISGVTFPLNLFPNIIKKTFLYFPLNTSISRIRILLQTGELGEVNSMIIEVFLDLIIIFIVMKLLKRMEEKII